MESAEENWKFNSLPFFLTQSQYKTMILWGAPFSFLKKTHFFGLKSMKYITLNAYLLHFFWKRIYKNKEWAGNQDIWLQTQIKTFYAINNQNKDTKLWRKWELSDPKCHWLWKKFCTCASSFSSIKFCHFNSDSIPEYFAVL